LNDLGLDPYFPDGTWCHVEESQNYFCRQLLIRKIPIWKEIVEESIRKRKRGVIKAAKRSKSI
jgi:hypothetical protein